GLDRLERVDEPRTRVARVDDVVQVPAAGRYIRMCELFAVFVDFRIGRLAGVLALRDFLLEEDLHRAFRPHHRDLRRRPGDVVVAADVLGRHDVVRAAVRLTSNYSQFRDSRFTKSEEQLGAVANDTV